MKPKGERGTALVLLLDKEWLAKRGRVEKEKKPSLVECTNHRPATMTRNVLDRGRPVPKVISQDRMRPDGTRFTKSPRGSLRTAQRQRNAAAKRARRRNRS